MLAKLLSRLFRLEEINGNGRCPTYLFRWQLLRFRKAFAVYLHRFVADDWSLDLHDHPKRFVVLTLAGGYTEHTPHGSRWYGAPWLRVFPAEHTHRVTLPKRGECWSLVIVYRTSRPWGFWNAGRWILWREYVRGIYSHIADGRAVCQSIGGDQ